MAGIILTSLFTAAVTSNATVSRLQGSIDGPDDLAGKRIVTVADSTSEQWLKARGLPYRTVTSIDGASALLLDGSADAVVFDQLTLRYHATTHGAGALQVVGPSFDSRSLRLRPARGEPAAGAHRHGRAVDAP